MTLSSNKSNKIGGPTTTRVVYVGAELYKVLADGAIDVSYQGGRQITPSQLVQYLINNWGEEAKAKLIKEMKESEVK